MPYIEPEVIEQARQIDLLTYLRKFEPDNVEEVKGTRNVYRTVDHDSLKMSNGKWFWWSQGFGGYNALDYLIKVRNYSFMDAVEILTGKELANWTPPPKKEEKNEPKVLRLPEKYQDSKRVALAVKAIIAGTKALIAAIAAGGWIAVLVIIVICLIGMLLGSVFGIFFSGEDSGTGMSMQTVVQEINTEYDTKLQDEKNSVSYDVLEMSGSRAVWKEVLAVYSVKVNTDPDNPQEVATMDESKKQLLKDIFWEMNEISSSTDTKTETVITETDDGHGNIVETESTVTQTYLYITVSHKTADEMAAQYGFNEEQKEYLAELLVDENNSLWSQVLYGITGTDDQIVTVALSQIGNMGGEPYWSWYGFNSRVEWCACFVSWCANECGYIDAGVIPKYAGCVNGVQWFKDRGQWLDNSAEPAPGMIIFFDWADESGQDGLSDHTGIVQKVENGRVYTVEGNSGDSVRQNSYPVGYYEILGYGAPAY